MKIKVDYDRPTGAFAVWVREHAAALSIGLVLFGMVVSSLGLFNMIPRIMGLSLENGPRGIHYRDNCGWI
jgi:hypothetical protein